MKERIIDALKRAGWTAAEVALAMIPVGVGVEEVNWLHVLSVVAVATVISLLKSIIAGMPETVLAAKVKEQELIIEEASEAQPIIMTEHVASAPVEEEEPDPGPKDIPAPLEVVETPVEEVKEEPAEEIQEEVKEEAELAEEAKPAAKKTTSTRKTSTSKSTSTTKKTTSSRSKTSTAKKAEEVSAEEK